jgi:hypothetical protein
MFSISERRYRNSNSAAPIRRNEARFRRARRPRLESLEERALLTAYVVDTIADDPLATAADTDGFVSLREAIQAANTNAPFGDAAAGDSGTADEITFDAALTGLTIVLGGAELTVSDDLKITGLGAENLTISGNGLSRVFSVDASAAAHISHVTVSDGQAAKGGGIYNLGTLTLESSAIKNNAAISPDITRGGGIFNGGNLSIIQSAIRGNSSIGLGFTIEGEAGGIHNQGTLEIFDSVVENNFARRGGGGLINAPGAAARILGTTFSGNACENFNAGAIGNSGTLEVIESLFFGNTAGSAGGAIFSDGPADISDSEFTGNSAFLWGGGIYNRGSTLTLRNSELSNNSISRFGGAIANAFGGIMEIDDSTLSGNFAAREGGAIENFVATLRITNSTISGNSSEDGGAIWNRGALTLLNVSLAMNRADTDGNGLGLGGGIYNEFSTPLLYNTILAGNLLGAAGSDAPDDIYGSIDPTSSHNLIGDAATAGGLSDGVNGNIVGNAGVGSIDITTVLDPNLSDNGGSTLTHALVTGSFAINAGDNTLAVDGDGNPLPFDQRGNGFPRIVGAAVDIGAFEAPPPPLAVGIDIKPGSDNNPIDLASQGVLTVAILTTADFDAALVDAGSVQFAGAYAVHSALEDVDGDGDLDMVLHFCVQETNLADVYAGLLAEDPTSKHQSASLRLEGKTIYDELFAGEDFADLFLAGKSLRELLEELALQGLL